MNIQTLLNDEYTFRNQHDELSFDKPDPLLIAKKHNDEYIALICALFSYGNASLIVKFINSLDYDLLNCEDKRIEQVLQAKYYRFQKSSDVIALFIALKRLKQIDSLENIFYNAYKKENCILEGMDKLIKTIHKSNPHHSQGYTFLVGSSLKRDKQHKIKYIGNAPYKRWNMYLRWMVRRDNLDMGLWSKIDKSDLILPLDTHTFKVSQKMGLLNRKIYDLKSAILITEKLREYDPLDPIKYDFALYRLGQEKIF
ncbi:MAG: TIGR02757 family protein [Campylobacterota bacterium]|nr:TIGR02757 family protein [Campylobacterota bacterium]